MHLYGKSRYLFSPGGTTLHHSRGCTSSALLLRGGQQWQIEKIDEMEMKLFLEMAFQVSEPYDGENRIAYYRSGKRSYCGSMKVGILIQSSTGNFHRL